MLHKIGAHMSVLEEGSCLTEGVDCSAAAYIEQRLNSVKRGKVRSGPQICLGASLLIIAKPNLDC